MEEEFKKMLEAHSWDFANSDDEEEFKRGLEQSRKIAKTIQENLDLYPIYCEYLSQKQYNK